MLRTATILALSCLAVSLAGCTAPGRTRSGGPWNLPVLSMAPSVTWGAKKGLVQELYYQGVTNSSGPTRVFAYLGRPSTPMAERRPAVVLVHGGGGKAFPEWAEHWAKRGYVALAMDLGGNGPNGRLPDGGPDQSDAVKFREFTAQEAPDMWTYHAVSSVILGHSLLRSLPDVDTNRVGVTGISWGGYLTCMVAGLDARFKAAAPVYGCGFLGDNSVWKDRALASMTPASRDRWLKLFDPSRYLGQVECPVFFLNGTTDFAYPLDSYQKTYRLVPESKRYLSVVIDLPHGHIWTFPEVDAFMDGVLLGETSVPRLGPTRLEGRTLIAHHLSPLPLRDGTLCYTTDLGPWEKRKWKTAPADIGGADISATLPVEAATVAFFAVRDERGLRASSEHLELLPGAPAKP